MINYEVVGYTNVPSTSSPLNADNFNHMDSGIKAACDSVDRHDGMLDDRLKQTQTSSIYARAISEMNNIPRGALDRAIKAVNGGTLKFAIWGDSISGNFEQNGTDDAYAARLAAVVKEALPNVTVTYQNFAIGGKTIYNAVDSNFVGGDTNTSTTFKTDWSVNGKAWKDHVKDFAPDLLIVAFGMNESVGYEADELEANYLETLVNITKAWTIASSLVIVPTILPTRNTDYYSQSNNMTLAVSRASRLMAKNLKLAVADASRLYQILRDGKDDVTRATVSEFDFSDYANWKGDKNKFTLSNGVLTPSSTNGFVYNNHDFYEGAIAVSITPTIDGANGETQILYRYTTDIGSMKLIIGAGSGTGYVKLYNSDAGGEHLLGSTASLNIAKNSASTVKVVVSGKTHTIYINGVSVLTVSTYANLHDGKIGFGGAVTPPTFSSLQIDYHDPISGKPLYTELELLGDYNGPQAGNSINHPSGLGHALFYLPAFYGVIKELNQNLNITETVTLVQNEGSLSATVIKCYKKSGWAYIGGQIHRSSAMTDNISFTGLPIPASIYGDISHPIYVNTSIVGTAKVTSQGYLSVTLNADAYGHFNFAYPIG